MLCHDFSQNFLLEKYNARGAFVQLDETFQTILSQRDYPPAIQTLLGETLLTAGLLAAISKLQGRLIVQFQSEQAIQMLVAQINQHGHMRALAKWDSNADHQTLLSGLKKGQLVITIFEKNQPYQSIVDLNPAGITHSLTHYFLQSEQLATQFYFSVKEKNAVGLLLQMLPEKNEEDRLALWQSLMTEMSFFPDFKKILQDPSMQLFPRKPLAFTCSCNLEKMKNALLLMGEEEANHLLKDKREIVVNCEYCNNEYAFDRNAVSDLFRHH